MITVTPFLTLEKRAEELIKAYEKIFSSFEIVFKNMHPEPNQEYIQLAKIKIFNQEILISDSLISHKWVITPGISMFIEVNTEVELKDFANKLLEGGKYHMPPDDYGFSRLFCWVEDKFLVNWQINLK